jgi:hypothetical protein
MNSKYRDALPELKAKVSFKVEEISGVDLFYNDGDSRVRNSFFKLVFTRENHSVCVVYIQEGSWWVSYGSLTDKESLAIHDWIDARG